MVRAFRGEDGMKKFREWVMNPDEEELREAAQPKPKRGRKKAGEADSAAVAAEGGLSRIHTSYRTWSPSIVRLLVHILLDSTVTGAAVGSYACCRGCAAGG